MKKLPWFVGLLWIVSVATFLLNIADPFGWPFYLALFGFLTLTASGLLWIGVAMFRRKKIVVKIAGVVPGLLGALIVFVGLSLSINYKWLIPGFPTDDPAPADWQADFTRLKFMLRHHPIFLDSLDPLVVINDSVDFAALNDDESLVAFMRAIGKIPDGHSHVHPFQPAIHSRFFPLQGFWFDDGYYITTTANRYRELRGLKVVSIDGHNIDEVFRSIGDLIGPDNEWNAKIAFDQFVFSANVLHGLGLIADPQQCTIGAVDEHGVRSDHVVTSETFVTWLFWALKPIDALQASPARMNLRKPNYLMHTDPSTGSIIIPLHLIQLIKGYGLKMLADDIDREIAKGNTTKIVFDLRNSLGGDNTRYKPLLTLLTRHPDIPVFVFTSRKTFSASVNFISDLRKTTTVTMIGEPTGAGPNHYGDPGHVLLNRTGISLFLSTRAWVYDSLDRSNAYKPDVFINYEYDDYRNNVDPWMEALGEHE